LYGSGSDFFLINNMVLSPTNQIHARLKKGFIITSMKYGSITRSFIDIFTRIVLKSCRQVDLEPDWFKIEPERI
jgi:hypothetical protein